MAHNIAKIGMRFDHKSLLQQQHSQSSALKIESKGNENNLDAGQCVWTVAPYDESVILKKNASLEE